MARKSNKETRGFSPRELRAILWLLPVLAVVSWLVWVVMTTADSGRTEKTDIARTDSSRSATGEISTSSQDASTPCGDGRHSIAESLPSALDDGMRESSSSNGASDQLFDFDPNTIRYHDLVRLGFTRGEALGIIKYRERGKVFEIPEDFAACYQVSEAMYLRLRPHIRIGEEFRLKPFGWANNRKEGASSSLRGAGGGEAIRDTTSGLHRASNPRNDVLIELNTADSAALISISGIGEKTVVSIMDYRARLGGFVRAGQLAEVRGVTEQNFERIVAQIFVDTLAIKKLDINFAPAKSIATHPYIRPEALRKLLKQRQLKGGWRTAGELETDDIFTREELDRLVPYLTFN